MKAFQIFRKWWMKKRVKRTLISKRQEFVFATTIMTISLMITQLTQNEMQYQSIIALAFLCYVLSVIVLRDDLSGIEFFTLPVLPVLFTVAVSLFYFLLPARLLTRFPIVVLYAIGIYALFLTENIYNVAAERTIALLRAAQSVGFLITLITVFFLVDAALSLHSNAFFNMGAVFIILLPLVFQSLWSMELTTYFSADALVGGFAISLILSQVVFVFSFWPIQSTIESLFLTTAFYTIVGMSQQHLVGRLFKKTKIEFLSVFIFVFLLIIFTSKWGFGKY